jgi:hypothetical protein
MVNEEESVDWYNRTYELTGDDLVYTPVPVYLSDGVGTATGGDLGGYDSWSVEIQGVVEGSLPDLGDVTGILFKCDPQPANFHKQELRIYSSADGSEIARIPTIEESPRYQGDRLEIYDNVVRADVLFWGPDDTTASGPSILRHLSWQWNGYEFERIA